MHPKYGNYRQRTMDLTFTIRSKKIPRKFAVDVTFLWNRNIIDVQDYHHGAENFSFNMKMLSLNFSLTLSKSKMLSIPCYTRYQDLNKSTKMIFCFMLYFSNVIFILTGHYLLLAYQIQLERGIAAFSICLFIGNIFQGLSI